MTLVGTAHVSAKSVEEVRETIRELQPQVVCVELDEGRLHALRDPEAWERIPVVELLREGKGPQLIAQVFLASYQRRIGERTGVMPGAELLAAVEEAEAVGAEVVLADREVGITLRRAFSHMGFREKSRIVWELFKALVGMSGSSEELDADSVDELLEDAALEEAMAELAELAPSAKEVLIDERDAYLASNIAKAAGTEGRSTVAVLGAGHLAGVRAHLTAGPPIDLARYETVEKRRVSIGKVVGYAIPLAIVALFGYFAWIGFQSGDWRCFLDVVGWYVLIVGGSAALGAALAGGHPFSIAAGFLAAPITVIHPALAAGWFAGFVEAWRRTPTVADFQGLATLTTFTEMRKNRVMRVLFVAALCNITTSVGAAVVLARLLGVEC